VNQDAGPISILGMIDVECDWVNKSLKDRNALRNEENRPSNQLPVMCTENRSILTFLVIASAVMGDDHVPYGAFFRLETIPNNVYQQQKVVLMEKMWLIGRR
jgi:hypothetical protein